MRYRVLLIGFLAAISLSCQAVQELSLVDEDPGWDERRRRMNITVRRPVGSDWTDPEELTPQQFEDELRAHCNEIVNDTPEFATCNVADGGVSGCMEAVCDAHVQTCIANIYLELSRTLVPVDLEGMQGPVRVPPQSTATNAGFAESAIAAATNAITRAGENLAKASAKEYPGLAQCDAMGLAVPIYGQQQNVIQTFGESLASTLVEGTQIAKEAAEQALRDNIAVAETDRLAIADRSRASRTAWFAPVLSRMHGIQLFIGGDGYLQDDTAPAQFDPPGRAGVCTVQCINPRCSFARDLIRKSGMNLVDVIDLNIPALELVEGIGLQTPGGLQERLTELYQNEEMGGWSSQQFLTEFDLTAGDIEKAREFLRAEASFFHRDMTVETAQPILPAADSDGPPLVAQYVHFAATSRPPTATPTMYHISMARASEQYVDDRRHSMNTPVAASAAPTPTYATRGLGHVLDYAQSIAQYVVSKNSLSESVSDISGVLLAQRLLTNPVRVENCYRVTSEEVGGNVVYRDEIRVRVHGMDDPAKVMLVDGTSGLACAETGFVEGEPCRLDDYRVDNVAVGHASHNNYDWGYDSYVQLQKSDLQFPQPFRYYVLRLRDGATGTSAGNWEAMSSVTTNYAGNPGDAWEFCHNEPFQPALMHTISAAMTVDNSSCDRGPANDCYGAHTGPLPLEDELIDDSDPYENSFRHHLRVARDAADYSDELGRQLVEAGLGIDRDANEALNQLGTLCGGEFGLQGLFDDDGGLPRHDLNHVVAGTCTSSCADEYQCVGGYCIHDMIAAAALSDADAVAIAECLGGDETSALVVLGSKKLCIWRDAVNANVLCDHATVDSPCPAPVPEGGECDLEKLPTGNAYVPFAEQEALGLFGSGTSGASYTGGTYVSPIDCSLIRRARNGERDVVEEIVRSNFFAIENVRAWAQRIGWSGYPEDFSELTIDGGHWRGTGNPFPDMGGAGVAEAWPCDAEASVTCGSDTTSLFCSKVAQCGNAEERAAFNDRMARAAITLAVLSGYGLGNLRLPVQYASGVDFYGGEDSGRSLIPDYRAPTPNQWHTALTGRWETSDFSGLIAVPSTNPGQDVWRRVGYGAQAEVVAKSSWAQPVAFLNFGRAQRDEVNARRITEAFWTGMSQGRGLTLRDVNFGPEEGLHGRACDYLEGSGFWDIIGDTGVCYDDGYLERSDGAGGVLGFFRLALEGVPVRIPGRTAAGRNGYFTDYWREFPYDINSEPNGGANFQPNTLHIASDGFREREALDAMELMCEAARAADEDGGIFCDETRPPQVRTAADIPKMRSYLSCIANKVSRFGEKIVLQGVPRRTVQMMRGDPVPVRPDQGEYGREVIALEQSLEQLGRLPDAIADQIRGYADSLELLEIALAGVQARRELSKLQTASSEIANITACVSRVAEFSLGSVASCANSAAQIVMGAQMLDINLELLNGDQRRALIEFHAGLAARQLALAEITSQISVAAGAANTALSSMRSTRREARWKIAGALFSSSDEAGRHYQNHTVTRRRYNTLRDRYLEAHRAAVQYAMLARRALEQRLGADIVTLAVDRPLTLVDDPRTWANSACESTGINYARLRDEGAEDMESYADEFIGDYVRRLERVLESYRLDYPYVSGRDGAVVSIRDDLWTIREQCAAPTHNLLAASGDLVAAVEPMPTGNIPNAATLDGREPAAAWGQSGCLVDPSEDVEGIENCVTLGRVSDSSLSVDALSPAHRVSGFRVTFAPGDGASFHTDSDWGQSLPLGSGVYRLSWYGRCVNDNIGRDPASALSFSVSEPGSGGSIPVTSSQVLYATVPVCGDGICNANETGCSGDCGMASTCRGWTRYFQIVSFDTGGIARVGIRPNSSTDVEHGVDIAAVQLEFVGDRVFDEPSMITQPDVDALPERYYPRPFVATTSFGTAVLPACSNESGDRFRRRWAYRCLPLCSGGFDECGIDENGTSHCYWETELVLDLNDIERRGILPNGGFALGNYNYRFDDVALNFVGTGTRDCSRAGAPETCYGSGFIPYSIEHLPLGGAGYSVRNYTGGEYKANLFVGRIEHARGLASERYLTNPLSSTDQGMLSAYMRGELRGRPISGRFRIRVWDEPGVSFHNIEDVQLVLGYRYLTRTSAP